MILIANDTLQYPEYNSPNWIEGEEYEAIDNGTMLTLGSEQGGDFYFEGDARQFIYENFTRKEEDSL